MAYLCDKSCILLVDLLTMRVVSEDPLIKTNSQPDTLFVNYFALLLICIGEFRSDNHSAIIQNFKYSEMCQSKKKHTLECYIKVCCFAQYQNLSKHNSFKDIFQTESDQVLLHYKTL